MKKLPFILILLSNYIFAQSSNDSLKASKIEMNTCGRNFVGGGFGKFALYYLNYEYKMLANNWSQSTLGFGYGGAHGDADGGMPSYNNLSVSINQYIGFRPVFATIGLIPTLNFYGKVTYIELNGRLGLKYEIKNCDNPLTIEIGRMMRLYRTHYNDVAPAYYLGFGVNI